MSYVAIQFPSTFYDATGAVVTVPTPDVAAALPLTAKLTAPIARPVDFVHVAALAFDGLVKIVVHPTLGLMITPKDRRDR